MGRKEEIEKLKNAKPGSHFCKLNKMPKGVLDSFDNAEICDIDFPLASTITARYNKGIGAHKDNMILEVKEIGMSVKERFFRQAEETFLKNDCKPGDTINAYNRTVDQSGTSPTITTRPEGFKTAILPVVEKENNEMAEEKKTVYRIRKLTPKECFRLMDVTDEDADKMLSVNSNSQCYKQAGNSIVVACLIALFSQLNICQNGIQLKTWNEGLYKDLGYDKDEVGGGQLNNRVGKTVMSGYYKAGNATLTRENGTTGNVAIEEK